MTGAIVPSHRETRVNMRARQYGARLKYSCNNFNEKRYIMARKASEQKTHEKTWRDISGKMTVWGNRVGSKNEFIAYSTTVSSKNVDGQYVNAYLNVRFKKDDDPDATGRIDINVKSGFISCAVGTDGVNRLHVYVQDYDVIKYYEEEK